MNAKVVRRSLVAWVMLAAASASVWRAVGAAGEDRIPAWSRARTTGAVHAFLGIPYAAPPVGDLRWKPPAPAAKWTGVRKATEFGAHCMQGKVYGDMNFRDAGGSEDCLTLNVWVPAKTSASEAAGDGLDLWRRIRRGHDFGSAAGWHASGAAGRDRG